MTKEISQLKMDFCREVAARLSREEELVQLREKLVRLEELGKKDSELQQKSLHCWLLSGHLKRCVNMRRGRKQP